MKYLVIALILGISACASIENKCLDELNARGDISDALKISYYNSCVTRETERRQAIANAFNGWGKNQNQRTNCHPDGLGGMYCQ